MIWHAFWIALIVSLDTFSVGITYGMRKIRLPFPSVMVLSICSGMVIFASMNMGNWLAKWLPPFAATIAGATIFIALGFLTLIQEKQKKDKKCLAKNQLSVSKKIRAQNAKKFQWKQAYSIIQVLRSPTVADIDQSGTISTVEAFFLGMALSLDSLIVGLGASTIGISPMILTGIVFILSSLFLYLGMWLGIQMIGNFWRGVFVYVPGISFILIGLLRLIG